MRALLLALLLLPVQALPQRWSPEPRRSGDGLRFQDDLDFFLDGYTKPEIKAMRKQVNTWRMHFDKMMRATLADLRSYSEGGNLSPVVHPFTLPLAGGAGSHALMKGKGKVRAFMFGSITNPPARMQLPRWDSLRLKYDTAQVDLFVVYGRELHPGDKKRFHAWPGPRTVEEKAAYAVEFAGLTGLPVVVDGLDDAVFTAYGRAPNGAYLIDADGQLVFRGTWADSRKMEEMMDRLLRWYAAGRPAKAE
jgi:hypothetical protein